MEIILSKPIVFFDLETTGIDVSKDRIVELAFIKIMPNNEREEYIKRINPQMPIPAEASAVHGIYDDDVKDAPTFKQIAKELFHWLKNCDFAGYNNARFDLPLLVEEFLRAQVDIDFENRAIIDVQQIFFKMEQRTLKAALSFYCNQELVDAHSAAADTQATIDVFEAQLKKYQDLPRSIEHIQTYLGSDDTVDYARRLVKKDSKIVFNFGKYKGQVVTDIFTKDPSYYDWMMKSDFTLHTKQKISEILNEMKLSINKKS